MSKWGFKNDAEVYLKEQLESAIEELEYEGKIDVEDLRKYFKLERKD